MIALLDTHSFLWAVVAPEKLSVRMRGVIADAGNEIHVSTITFWEVALKYSLGKLRIRGGTPDDLVGIGRQMGLTVSAPTAEECAGFYRLVKVAHKDPFDRMLIWQCLQRQWTLITRDKGLGEYHALGLLTDW